MISISKDEISDKMFFIREEDSNQPIAVIKVTDLLEKEVKKNTENKCPCDSCPIDYEEGCCCERYIQWHGMRGKEE
jgi:hypothetical protein